MPNCSESDDGELSEGSDGCCDTDSDFDSDSHGMRRLFVHRHLSFGKFVTEQ